MDHFMVERWRRWRHFFSSRSSSRTNFEGEVYEEPLDPSSSRIQSLFFDHEKPAQFYRHHQADELSIFMGERNPAAYRPPALHPVIRSTEMPTMKAGTDLAESFAVQLLQDRSRFCHRSRQRSTDAKKMALLK